MKPLLRRALTLAKAEALRRFWKHYRDVKAEKEARRAN